MGKEAGIALLAFLCSVLGCTALHRAESIPQATLVTTQSFAPGEIGLGEALRIYLHGSDPNGEVTKISLMVDHTGQIHAERIAKLSKEDAKEFSGYLNLPTASLANIIDGTSVTVWVRIENESGNSSQPAIFPLTFKSQAIRTAPPQGVFKERDLGPVVTEKSSISDSLMNLLGSGGSTNSPNPSSPASMPPSGRGRTGR